MYHLDDGPSIAPRRTTTWSSMMTSSTMLASIPVPERWRWWGWAFCHPPSMVVVLWERPPSPPLRCLRPRCICSVYRPQRPSLATYNRARLGLWMIILLCWGKRLATTYGWMTGMQIARLLTILGIYGVIVHLRPEAQQYHCNHSQGVNSDVWYHNQANIGKRISLGPVAFEHSRDQLHTAYLCWTSEP